MPVPVRTQGRVYAHPEVGLSACRGLSYPSQSCQREGDIPLSMAETVPLIPEDTPSADPAPSLRVAWPGRIPSRTLEAGGAPVGRHTQAGTLWVLHCGKRQVEEERDPSGRDQSPAQQRSQRAAKTGCIMVH